MSAPASGRRVPRGVTFAAIALAAVAGFVLLRPTSATPDYRATGRPADLPAEQLAAVSGPQFQRILVGLRGRPVVVNIWASWCPPCRAEMPLLQRAARDYEGRVVFLGVASKDALGDARAFLDDVRVTYPNLFDATGDIRRDLQLRGFPTTYVFDRDGRLRKSVIGGITEPRLAAQLEDLLR